MADARFMVDADAVLRAAYAVCRRAPSQLDSAEAVQNFERLSVALGAALRYLAPAVAAARSELEPESLGDGHSVDLADGSRVTVDADGIVRHSVPDSVLLAMGVKPATQAALRGVAALPLAPDDAGLLRRLVRHERHRHAKGGDRTE